MAGLRSGDFLLEIDGAFVVDKPHDQIVDAMKKGSVLMMTNSCARLSHI